MATFLLLALFSFGVTAGPIVRRDTMTSVVDFANNTGTPGHLASGILYGVPNNVDQIPSQYFTDIDLNYIRAGGAQVPAPGRGWIWGLTEYENRLQTVVDNYNEAQKYNATFIFLIHDLWGADGTQNSSAPYPGDNNSWVDWDNYLVHVFGDMRTNGMTKDIVIDIWNEPDGAGFWNRPQDQYLQMWGRTYYKFRAEFGTSVLLSGPASAGEPLANNTWWENWCSFVSTNDSIPDQYVWHMEGGGGDLLSANDGLHTLLSTYGLPERPININEYGVYAEQVPAGSAWWISQLERLDAHGLRGNWLSGWQLHDFEASLLGKPNATNSSTYSPTASGYWPNGDWQLYRYYAQNMTGHRIGTSPSSSLHLDTYATFDPSSGTASILAGVRLTPATYSIRLTHLSTLGLPTNGTLNIHTYAFRVNPSNVHYGAVIGGPTDLGWAAHAYDADEVSFPVYQTDNTTAYAFEFSI